MSFMDGPTKGEEGEELFVVRRRIRGPLWWADAFCADRQGRYLSTHDDTTFGVGRGCKMRFGMSTSFDKNDTGSIYAAAQGCIGLGGSLHSLHHVLVMKFLPAAEHAGLQVAPEKVAIWERRVRNRMKWERRVHKR